ncbi:MAG: ABC transporter permease subunit [Clostridia bacterium]|nr:ABC transporter permease subunit [Clostridia bacterium]
MGKTFNLFKGELKKIFLGPGIFFMTAFLILLLTIAPKLFTPAEKVDLSSSISISTRNVESAYSSFLEYKADYSTKLNEIQSEIQELIENKSNFKESLVELSNNIHLLRMKLDQQILVGTEEDLSDCLTELIITTEQFNSLYNSYMTEYLLPVILVDEELDHNIRIETSQLLKLLNQTGDKSARDFYVKLNDSLENYKSAYNIKNYTNKIKNLDYNDEKLKELLKKYYNPKEEYKNELLTSITEIANQASIDTEYNISKTNINNIKNLAFNYLSVDDSSFYSLQNGLYLEVATNKSDAEMSSYLGFEEFNAYKYKENLNRYSYLLENNLSNTNFANMFSFNSISGSQENAFDYMYFTLEIASFFIIAFTVILGAGMIAKEYSEGTIKLLAIRPYKRNKIIMAKILATMFLAFIFVLVCTIVSLITGCILYGISFPTMIVTFNASITFTLPIWVIFLIYLACLMIKIWIFALLAISISTIFKSYIAAVCISSGIYILNIILTFVSKGANWLKYNIFANLDLFKYFGGSFTTSYTANQNLTNLFLSPVFADTSIWVTIITIGVLAIILNLILFNIFKHRDIN